MSREARVFCLCFILAILANLTCNACHNLDAEEADHFAFKAAESLIHFVIESNKIVQRKIYLNHKCRSFYLGTSLYRQQPSKQSDLELKLNKSVSFREVEEDI